MLLVCMTESQASEVDVLYVDYGNRERLHVDQLRPLPHQFISLPTQAICCALAEVGTIMEIMMSLTVIETLAMTVSFGG